MSWSVEAIGKGEAVARSLGSQFTQLQKHQHMPHPQNGMMEKVAWLVLLATGAAPRAGFHIKAEGHQITAAGDGDPIHGMHLKVEIDMIPLAE